MLMRYVVAGVGRQGLSAVYDLVCNCEASEVLAIDARLTDDDCRKEVQAHVAQLLDDRAAAVRLQGADLSVQSALDQLADDIRGFDCLISALPYALNGKLSQVAIAAGVPMCDMGGNPDMVDQQQQLAATFNHVLVPECGLAPGIANVFIKYLHEHHGATHIQAFCGGLPKDKPDPAANPLQYKLVFSPQGLISEYMGECPILDSGKVHYAAALSGLEQFDDEHEAFYTSNNSPRILEYFAGLGIEQCRYKTLRYAGHLEKIRVLRSLGYLRRHDNTDPDLAQRLAGSAALKFDRAEDEDKVVLAVRGSADGAAPASIELIDHLDPETRFTAMERTTAWGTTIVAHALAKGISGPTNFATPEQFIDTKWFIEQLSRRTKHITINTG
jgi:lysine 6-dehydrogenase